MRVTRRNLLGVGPGGRVGVAKGRNDGGLLLGERIEESRLLDGGAQRVQSLLNDIGPEFEVLLGRESGAAANVLDAGAPDHAWGASCKSEAEQGGDEGHRDAGPLDLLRYRCAATIAGPSGGDHDDGVHLLGCELLGHLLPDAFGIRDRRPAARGAEVLMVDRVDHAAVFERTHHI